MDDTVGKGPRSSAGLRFAAFAVIFLALQAAWAALKKIQAPTCCAYPGAISQRVGLRGEKVDDGSSSADVERLHPGFPHR